MANQILREIALSIQYSKCFSLMAGEVTDILNVEQVAICLCYVDENFELHEDLVGLLAVDNIKSDVCWFL